MYVKNALISVQNETILADNKGSALELVSSSLIVLPGTVLSLNNNHGFNGAGLYLRDGSRLFLKGIVNIIFSGNEAKNKGGAIYQTDDEIDYHPILSLANSNKEDNTALKFFSFTNNTAFEGGNSIFSTSMNLSNCNNTRELSYIVPYYPDSTKEDDVHFNFSKCDSKEIQLMHK